MTTISSRSQGVAYLAAPDPKRNSKRSVSVPESVRSLVAARLADANRCIDTRITDTEAPSPGANGRSSPNFDCYLLGKFDTRYILLGRSIAGATASELDPGAIVSVPTVERHRIYIKQVIGQGGLEPFAILAYSNPQPVRGLIVMEEN